MPKLGWLEATILVQTLLLALLFVPGITPLRTALRVIGTLWPMAAWGAVIASGRKPPPGMRFAARPFLVACTAWLLISVFHPDTNTLAAGLAEAFLNISIFCPAFWVPALVTDARQVRRLLVIIFLCNALGVAMGIGQVYRPDTFNPPYMPMVEAMKARGSTDEFKVETEDGRKILRPPGLTDTPGGAAVAGTSACLIGLALALTPMAWWKRLGASGVAMAGVGLIFFGQVRIMLIVLVLGVAVLAGMLALGREFRKLTLLAALAALMGVGAIGWVMRTGGMTFFKRFLALAEEKSGTVYYANRGRFVENGLTVLLPEHPLGAGLGRYGMMNAYFGDPFAPASRAMIWAETQVEAWVIDGGIVMLVFAPGAIVAALLMAARVARTCPDRGLRYWAIVVAAMGATTTMTALGSIPFAGPSGLQFWVLIGALAGADAVARRRAPRDGRPEAAS